MMGLCMTNEDTVVQIELDMEDAREIVGLTDSLNRLMKNADFISLIKVGYFKNEPARLTELKASPHMHTEVMQLSIIKQIDAIGGLQQYFNKIRALGEHARIAIEEANVELGLIAAEDAA